MDADSLALEPCAPVPSVALPPVGHAGVGPLSSGTTQDLAWGCLSAEQLPASVVPPPAGVPHCISALQEALEAAATPLDGDMTLVKQLNSTEEMTSFAASMSRNQNT